MMVNGYRTKSFQLSRYSDLSRRNLIDTDEGTQGIALAIVKKLVRTARTPGVYSEYINSKRFVGLCRR